MSVDTLMPFAVASAAFVERTSAHAFASASYLPGIDDPSCGPCAARLTHSHANMPYVTTEQLEAAVALYFQDVHMAEYDL